MAEPARAQVPGAGEALPAVERPRPVPDRGPFVAASNAFIFDGRVPPEAKLVLLYIAAEQRLNASCRVSQGAASRSVQLSVETVKEAMDWILDRQLVRLVSREPGRPYVVSLPAGLLRDWVVRDDWPMAPSLRNRANGLRGASKIAREAKAERVREAPLLEPAAGGGRSGEPRGLVSIQTREVLALPEPPRSIDDVCDALRVAKVRVYPNEVGLSTGTGRRLSTLQLQAWLEALPDVQARNREAFVATAIRRGVSVDDMQLELVEQARRRRADTDRRQVEVDTQERRERARLDRELRLDAEIGRLDADRRRQLRCDAFNVSRLWLARSASREIFETLLRGVERDLFEETIPRPTAVLEYIGTAQEAFVIGTRDGTVEVVDP
jgi:hypothetical protein